MSKKYNISWNVLLTEDRLTDHYRYHLLNHLVTVFEWAGFDEECPVNYLEMLLLTEGVCGIIKQGDKFIPMRCNAAERPDEYYRPTSYIYANPVLGSGKIEPDAVIFNDLCAAWFPLDCKDVIDKYAQLLAAAEISLKIALKNSRLTNIIVTDNEDDVANIDKMLTDIANGALATTVNTKTLIGEGVKVFPAVTSGVDYMRQIAESREYLYNLFLSEFGIHANTVLKRERQLTGEIDMQIEKPVFNINSMLQAREESAARLSKTFGAEISVRINPKYMYVEEQNDGSESEVKADDVPAPDTKTDDSEPSDDTSATSDSNNVPD